MYTGTDYLPLLCIEQPEVGPTIKILIGFIEKQWNIRNIIDLAKVAHLLNQIQILDLS